MADDRFDRLESKIDKLTDVVVDLARVEERQIDMQEGIKRMWTKMEAQDNEFREVYKRIRPLENKLASIGWIERIAWVVVLGALAAYFKSMS